MSKIKFEDLLGTGAHFGHVTRKWDPNFKPYVLMEKNGIHIINLDETIRCLDVATTFLESKSKKGGEFLLLVQRNRLRILYNKKQIDAQCFMLLSAGLEVHLQTLQPLKRA